MFTSFTIVAVLVGGVAELVPSLLVTPSDAKLASEAHLYTALEVEGRDIYIREGCYTCHSQMIRTFDFEAKRYGEPSTISESLYDHPFQWGSKRNGPDLAREGGKVPNLWHYRHLIDPRSVSPGSIMPPYPTLATTHVDAARTAEKLRALHAVGVPYETAQIDGAQVDEAKQAQQIADNLRQDGAGDADPRSEMIALVAYLQCLGKHPESSQPGAERVATAK